MKKRKSLLQKSIAAILLSAFFFTSVPGIARADGMETGRTQGSEEPNPLVSKTPETFCNPINLSYSYQYGLNRGTGGFRMLADPQPIYYQGEYWLFPTNATGYYHSQDLVNWEFVYSTAQQVNNYAPGVFEHGGYLYISRHSRGNLYRTKTPAQGNSWEYVRGTHCQDPYYFKDPDTGRIFEIHGCVGINHSDKDKKPPIYIAELDTNSPTLDYLPIDTSIPGADPNAGYPVFYMDRDQHGYEVPGQYNDDYNRNTRSWLEGGGMLKHKGRYYIYYSGPATECAAYCDGCYVSDDPLGPYTWCDSSPFAYKSTGFTIGAGHGHDIVERQSGRIWKFGSISIASNDSWERRLSLYPLAFDQYSRPVTDLSMADYPMYVPTSPKSSFEHQGPDWNLVSYGITATASSTYDARVTSQGAGESGSFQISPDRAFDENIRTWWSAETGNAGEWLMGDMGKECTVNALQLNFADQDAAVNGSLPDDLKNLSSIREYTGCYRYKIEYSLDGKEWHSLVDKSSYSVTPFQGQDTSHDYYELKSGVPMRYIRVTNQRETPAHGKFAISGLRLFGTANGEAPGQVSHIALSRIPGQDERSVQVSWNPVPGAEGYIIRYGTHEDSLNIHHQAIGQTTARIGSLSKNRSYYFRIDTYNGSGRTVGTVIEKIPGIYGSISYERISVTTGVGEEPELPASVQADTSKGKEDMAVRWEPVGDKSLLEQPGTFEVTGIVCETGDAVRAQVTVSQAIGVQAVSLGIAKGQQPALPEKVKVYYSNGTVQERSVSWDLTGADFHTAGVAEVTGIAGSQIAKAHVRVAADAGIDFTTPIGTNLALNENGLAAPDSWPRTLAYYSWKGDYAHNATNGRKDFVSNSAKVIWCDYENNSYHTNTNAEPGAADHVPFLATAFGEKGKADNASQRKYTVNQVSIGFMEEDGDSAVKVRLPSDYKIEYYSANNGILPAESLKANSASDYGNTKSFGASPINAQEGWTEVAYIGGKPSIPSVSDFKHMVDVKFEPVQTTVIRLTLTPQARNWTGLEELEAYYIPVAQHSSYEVEEIKIDGKDVLSQFSPGDNALTWESPEGDITASATNNAAITILKPANGTAKLIFLPENGDESQKKEYAITFQPGNNPGGDNPGEDEPDPPAPDPPAPSVQVGKVTALKAAPSQTSIKLSWKKVPGALGYLVFRSQPGKKAYKQIADTKKNSYTNKKLTSAAPYSYQVCAYKKDGKHTIKGKPSSTVKALTKPCAPSSVKIKNTSKAGQRTRATASLSFEKVSRATAYQIYKYDRSKKKYRLSYRIKGGKLYKYSQKAKKYAFAGKVKAKNGKITCTLKNLDFKKEKSQSYKIKALVSRKGYQTQAGAYSKKVTVK